MNPVVATVLVTCISCRFIDNEFFHAELDIEIEGITRSCIVRGETYPGLPLFIEEIKWADGKSQFDRFDLCEQIAGVIESCLPS